MVDIELKNTSAHYLHGQHIRYVDEFQRDKLIVFLENSGSAVIIDYSTGMTSDFSINKYDRIIMNGILKLPKTNNHYIIKHKNGFKIINALTKRWWETCYDM